jgi:hypothetical protein
VWCLLHCGITLFYTSLLMFHFLQGHWSCHVWPLSKNLLQRKVRQSAWQWSTYLPTPVQWPCHAFSSETLCECEQIVEQDTLREVDKIKVPVVAAVAAHFGSVRLIDNVELQPPSWWTIELFWWTYLAASFCFDHQHFQIKLLITNWQFEWFLLNCKLHEL